jgi:phosphoglycolate phosphatase
MSDRFRSVLFDFDYTLADSSRGVADCINYALRNLGLAPVSYEAACRTIGLSLEDTLLQVAGKAHADKSARFSRLFVARADRVMAEQTVLLASVPGVVRELRGRGLTLGIVSTKYRYRIEAILARESLLAFFQVIVGGEDVSSHKPNPESLLLALARLGQQPGGALYVGDSVTDAEAAQRASLPFVAVLSGVTPREAFEGYEVWAVLESLSELVAIATG